MNAPATSRELASPAVARPEDLVGYDLIRTLVAFPTVSRDSNLALIEWVRDYVESHGATTALTFDDDRRKANLFATLPAHGRQRHRPAASCCPATPTSCRSTASRGTPTRSPSRTADDRLYGRGVTDMKSFSAIGLAFVPRFLARGLARPLHFALSYDEEVGCIGVRRLIADIVARGIQPLGLHRRRADRHAARRRAQGQEELALPRARPRGAFVAHAARRQRRADRVRDRRLHRAACARVPRRAARTTTRTTCPYTTAHVGIIRGGTALNIVPRDCTFEFEIRHLPFDDPDAFFARRAALTPQRFLPEMHAVDPSTRTSSSTTCRRCPASTRTTAATIADARARAATARTTVGKVSFGTEASLFHNAIDAHDHLRARPHRAGAPAQRVGDARAARALRGVHGAPRRSPLRGVSTPAPAPRGGVQRATDPMPASTPPFAIDVAVPGPRRAGRRATRAFRTSGTFDRCEPGPRVTIQALTHGNEVCGAIALDWSARERRAAAARHADAGLRQRRGLPALRCRRSVRVALRRRGLQPAVDDDGARRPAPLGASSRAPASCAPFYDATDYLLDLHSMTDPCPPLALAGHAAQGTRARARRRRARSTS